MERLDAVKKLWCGGNGVFAQEKDLGASHKGGEKKQQKAGANQAWHGGEDVPTGCA
jgi:hypothetical protein